VHLEAMDITIGSGGGGGALLAGSPGNQ